MTPENDMKPDRIAGAGGAIRNTSGADTMVNYAQSNNMVVRGHTMVWYSQAGSLSGAQPVHAEHLHRQRLLTLGQQDRVLGRGQRVAGGQQHRPPPQPVAAHLDRDSNGDGDFFDAGDTDYIRDSFARAKQVVQQAGLPPSSASTTTTSRG